MGYIGRTALSVADIDVTSDTEPRLRDIRIGQRLGYKRRLDIQAFNAAHRHLSQMHREGWAKSEIRKARTELFRPLGITLDPASLQQGEFEWQERGAKTEQSDKKCNFAAGRGGDDPCMIGGGGE